VLRITVFLHPNINVFVAVSIIALQLSLLSYLGFKESTTILVKLEQLLKAESPIVVTLSGIVILVKFIQLLKA